MCHVKRVDMHGRGSEGQKRHGQLQVRGQCFVREWEGFFAGRDCKAWWAYMGPRGGRSWWGLQVTPKCLRICALGISTHHVVLMLNIVGTRWVGFGDRGVVMSHTVQRVSISDGLFVTTFTTFY